MSAVCPDPVLLAAYAARAASPEDRAGVEAHAASCPDCRRELRTLAGLAPVSVPVSRPRRAWWLATGAAAAALAIWCRAAWREPSEALPPEAGNFHALPTPPLPALPIPGEVFSAGVEDVEWTLGRAAHAALRRGGRIRPGTGASCALQAGTLAVDSPGEEVQVEAGDVRIVFSDARVSVTRASAPSAFSWIAQASAEASGPVSVAVGRGEAEIVLGASRVRLAAGQAVRAEDGRLVEVPGLQASAWWGRSGWQILGQGVLVLRDAAQDFLAPQPGGYVLEALVRKREPASEMSLRLAAGDGVHEIPVGSYLRGYPRWTRIRMECAGGWCRATVGGEEIVRCAEPELSRRWKRVPGAGAGLRAWGGDLEIRDLRWRRP